MGKENSIHIWTVIFKLHCVIFAKVMAYFQVLVPIQFYGNHSQMYYYQEKNVNLNVNLKMWIINQNDLWLLMDCNKKLPWPEPILIQIHNWSFAWNSVCVNQVFGLMLCDHTNPQGRCEKYRFPGLTFKFLNQNL